MIGFHAAPALAEAVSRQRSLSMHNSKDHHMPTKRMHFLVALVIALPGVALAQTQRETRSADGEYCKALARKYNSLLPAIAAPVAENALIASDCASDPTRTIATLEAKMKASHFDLPPRQEFAAGH
ncbi:hypothetical protein [Reyranella sp.]|uniref:hypothetical protein n=1 Tax=Reyranella sp. TaxID=1929291 RepID=UPI0025DDD402|nr:hypothetical protein [Reyranella sp.]